MTASQKTALHFGLNGLMMVIPTEKRVRGKLESELSKSVSSGIDPLVVRMVGEV